LVAYSLFIVTHFVFKLNLVLINRPAHNSGLAALKRPPICKPL